MQEINTQAPPPTYQQSTAPGQTYYEPPPQPVDYTPIPPTVGQRVTQFYAPPQNRKLGMMRKCYTFLICIIIVGLIIGLAAGMTRQYRYRNTGANCNCRTNADCRRVYGSGTYCYASCQCAYR